MFPSKQSPEKIFSEGVLLNGYTSKKNFPYVDSWFLDACQGSCTSTVEPGSQKKSSLFECWNNKYIIRHFQLLFTKHYHFVIYELETIACIRYHILFIFCHTMTCWSVYIFLWNLKKGGSFELQLVIWSFTLRKIYQNMGFFWPVFSRKITESPNTG